MSEETQQPEEEKTGFAKVMSEFVEHQKRAFEESCKAFDALLPPEFKEHSSAARDEFRKGVKLVVDYTIDELEKLTKEDPEKAKAKSDSGDDSPPSTTGRTKVKVQVD